MPRRARSIVAGGCYHVINRGNNRATVFHDAAEYAAFIGLLSDAQERTPIELFAACLMPNHFHLVVRPDGRHDIGRWIHWLLTTHSHRYHLRHETTGRVWQGPYKAFPIEQDGHLLTVLRYVERNAARAGLVTRSRDWHWGSAAWRHAPHHLNRLLTQAPVKLPSNWDDFLDEPRSSQEVRGTAGLRQSPATVRHRRLDSGRPRMPGLRQYSSSAGSAKKADGKWAGK